MELNSNLIKEFGHNMKALGNALKDGSIDAKEAEVCLRELKELITACIRLETYLNHQFSDSAPKEVLHER
jgi:translation initiation factor 2 alpha subunit (eIF-2alpha)